MVGLLYYNQSGVTELFILKNPHYDRMYFKYRIKPSEIYILIFEKLRM